MVFASSTGSSGVEGCENKDIILAASLPAGAVLGSIFFGCGLLISVSALSKPDIISAHASDFLAALFLPLLLLPAVDCKREADEEGASAAGVASADGRGDAGGGGSGAVSAAAGGAVSIAAGGVSGSAATGATGAGFATGADASKSCSAGESDFSTGA